MASTAKVLPVGLLHVKYIYINIRKANSVLVKESQQFKSCYSSCRFNRICKPSLLQSYSSNSGQIVKSYAETEKEDWSMTKYFQSALNVPPSKQKSIKHPSLLCQLKGCLYFALLTPHCETVTRINPPMLQHQLQMHTLVMEPTSAIRVSFQKERNINWMHINCAAGQSSSTDCQMVSQRLRTETSTMKNDLSSKSFFTDETCSSYTQCNLWSFASLGGFFLSPSLFF